MTSSALAMGAMGIAISFFPQEILNSLGSTSSGIPVLILQILGAQYLAFAMVNWMAKSNLIGGIYSRPIAMGNFMHFGISTIVLLKAATANPHNTGLWIAGAAYGIFGTLFARVFFTHPKEARKRQEHRMVSED